MDTENVCLKQSDRIVIAKLAWVITMSTGLAALAFSFVPGHWPHQAFLQLRWATLFYGSVAAFYLLTSGRLSSIFGYEPTSTSAWEKNSSSAAHDAS